MDKFEAMAGYFNKVDEVYTEKNKIAYDTGKGLFIPSNISYLDFLTHDLIEHGMINGPILDAGSGDGRYVALLKKVFGLDAAGIEYDTSLVAKAILHFDNLGIDTDVAAGDFTDDNVYSGIGRRFRDFKTIYHYVHEGSSLIEKINRESDHGAFIIYSGWMPEPPELDGLKLEYTAKSFAESDDLHKSLVSETDTKMLEQIRTYAFRKP